MGVDAFGGEGCDAEEDEGGVVEGLAGGDLEVIFPGRRRGDCTAGDGAEVGHEAEDALGLSAAEGDGIAVGVQLDGWRASTLSLCFGGLPFGFVGGGRLVAVGEEAEAGRGRRDGGSRLDWLTARATKVRRGGGSIGEIERWVRAADWANAQACRQKQDEA